MNPILSLTAVCLPVCFSAVFAAAQDGQRTEFVEGRVVDLRGEPVPAAAIAVSTWQDPDTVVGRGTSDGEGWFRVPKLQAAEGWNIRASKPDLVSSGEQASSGRRTVRVLMMETALVQGTLTNRAGQPVANAIVRAELFARIGSRTFADATTDAQGHFAVRAPLGFLQVAAVVPGEGLARSTQRIGGDSTIALAPDEGPQTSLAVRVTGVPADALDRVRLSVRPYGPRRYAPFPPPWHQPRFDAAGHWAIDHAPDCKYSIYLSSTRFSFAPRELEVKAGSGPHEVVFTATPIGSTSLPFAARARDAAGKPVAGIGFELRAPNGGTRTRATSDADGNLVFASPLALGEEAVVYSVDGAWVTDQDLPPRERMMSGDETKQLHHCRIGAQAIELRVVPACTVTGRLTHADGSPAAGVGVLLEHRTTGWPQWRSIDYTTTDRGGAYAFRGLHHVASPVRVAVSGGDGGATSEEFAIAEVGTQAAVPAMALRPPAIVEGIVRGPDQEPVAGVHVWLRDWDFARNQQVSGSVVETITDRRGRYRFVGVPEGGAWLQLLQADESPKGRATEPFAVEPGKTITQDLQLPAK
jgi:hypothetical protein